MHQRAAGAAKLGELHAIADIEDRWLRHAATMNGREPGSSEGTIIVPPASEAASARLDIWRHWGEVCRRRRRVQPLLKLRGLGRKASRLPRILGEMRKTQQRRCLTREIIPADHD